MQFRDAPNLTHFHSFMHFFDLSQIGLRPAGTAKHNQLDWKALNYMDIIIKANT